MTNDIRNQYADPDTCEVLGLSPTMPDAVDNPLLTVAEKTSMLDELQQRNADYAYAYEWYVHQTMRPIDWVSVAQHYHDRAAELEARVEALEKQLAQKDEQYTDVHTKWQVAAAEVRERNAGTDELRATLDEVNAPRQDAEGRDVYAFPARIRLLAQERDEAKKPTLTLAAFNRTLRKPDIMPQVDLDGTA